MQSSKEQQEEIRKPSSVINAKKQRKKQNGKDQRSLQENLSESNENDENKENSENFNTSNKEYSSNNNPEIKLEEEEQNILKGEHIL